MGKERPRYKAIREYEQEFKREYAKTIGQGFDELLKKVVEYSEKEKSTGGIQTHL